MTVWESCRWPMNSGLQFATKCEEIVTTGEKQAFFSNQTKVTYHCFSSSLSMTYLWIQIRSRLRPVPVADIVSRAGSHKLMRFNKADSILATSLNVIINIVCKQVTAGRELHFHQSKNSFTILIYAKKQAKPNFRSQPVQKRSRGQLNVK